MSEYVVCNLPDLCAAPSAWAIPTKSEPHNKLINIIELFVLNAVLQSVAFISAAPVREVLLSV